MAKVNTRKRGSKWEYRFEIAPVDGKRKQKSKGGFRTKKEALVAGTKALNEYNNTGLSITASDMSISDYMDLWFDEYCLINTKYSTQLSYRGQIENHIKPSLGEYRLKNLTPAMIQTFINNLKLKGLSKASIISIKSTLTSALRYAIHPLGLIQINPALLVMMPKFDTKETNRYVIPEKDFKTILNRFPPGNSFYIPLLIGYTCGLRISEAFCLDWGDIDFENKTLTVSKSIYKRFLDMKNQKGRLGWYIGSTKTIKSNRTILLDEFTLLELRKERNRQIENELYYGKYYTKLYKQKEIDEKGEVVYKIIESNEELDLDRIDMVMIRENGQYLNTDSFKYCAKVINHELKIKFNYHSLRHTHATILIENGANLKDVQERLGHSKLDQTFNTYTHNTKNIQNETIRILNNIVHT